MSFFCPPCCCKGVEGRAEYSLSLSARTTFKKYFQKISKSMSFWRLEGCGRGMGGDFARNWLRFGARFETAPGVGSVLAPKAKTKAGFSRVASILMPPPKAKSDYGINFDATEKFFSETLYFSRSHDLPPDGAFKKFSGAPIKAGLLIPYLVKGTENFLPDDLIFRSSRDLPLEGRNFSGGTRKNGASHS